MYKHGIQSLKYEVLILFFKRRMIMIIQRMNDSRYQILIEPMTVALLIKISPTIYAAPRFISSSYARGIQSLSHHPPLRFPLVLYFRLSSRLFHSPSESWNAFLISPCGLKVFISCFLTSSMSYMWKGTNYATHHHAASC